MKINRMEILLKKIKEDFSLAEACLNKMEELSYNLCNENDYFDEEYDFQEIILISILNSIYRKLAVVFEALNLPNAESELKQGFTNFKGKLGGFYHVAATLEVRNKALDFLYIRFDSISPIFDCGIDRGEPDLSIENLERILRGTPTIIIDSGIEPKNEADVQKKVFNVIKHTFPDVVREVPIPKQVKTYRPDFGVPSLSTAIEYKFCVSEEEVKKALDGILEDVSAYSKSKEWLKFYAVIYVTGNYFTVDQINEHFKSCNLPKKWKIILVTGKGNRDGKA